jgi:hypothetical protein
VYIFFSRNRRVYYSERELSMQPRVLGTAHTSYTITSVFKKIYIYHAWTRRRRKLKAGLAHMGGSVDMTTMRLSSGMSSTSHQCKNRIQWLTYKERWGGGVCVSNGRNNIIDPRTKPSYPSYFSAIYSSKTAGLIKINHNSRSNGALQLYNRCYTAKIQL